MLNPSSNLLRGVTVAGKLKVIIMAVTGASLLAACIAAAGYDIWTLRSLMVQNLSILADLMGSNSTASLSFQDADVANEVLRSLRAHPHITRAATFNAEGKLFAHYQRDKEAKLTPPVAEPEGSRFEANRLVLYHDIELDGDRIGKVFIESDLDEISSRAWTYAGMASVIMGAALAFAFTLSSRLQRVITDPLHDLSTTAVTVSRTKDYSLRAASSDREDEFGVLILAFNDMLEQIQERDQTLNKVNAELAKSEKLALEATEAKSSFLANMSHELRTPLNSIIGFSEVLLGEMPTGEARADLEMIHAAGKHLLTLINGILDLSKIEAGKMELYVEPYEVSKLVQEVQRTTEPLVKQRGNKLEVRIHDELGKVKLDVTKIRQCLLNLLSNANKFTEQGTVSLDVRKTLATGRSWIELQVTDTGIGMTPEQVDKLFQPFTQADGSTSRKYGGTGLGLTISKRFCEMMGGSITLSSEAGVGTTFTMRIPYLSADSPEASALLAGGDNARTVLIIDDDRQVHQLMQRFLTSEGWNVVTASSGPEGIRLAKQLRPAVITLDVMMAEMDGWAVLSKLKSDPDTANAPVVMVSIIDDKRMGYALGAADYVTKPIDRDTLVKVLGKYRLGSEPEPVLVIDDDSSTRAVIQRLLEQEGWRVSEAANGRDAVEQMKQERPRLILLDLMMPQMNGFEFIDELRRHDEWSGIPVVVVSGHNLSNAERDQLNGCVKSVIHKNAQGYDQMLHEIQGLVSGMAPKPVLPSMEPKQNKAASAAPATGGAKAARSLKVLLADDNAFNQRLAVRVLKGMGHEVTVANDGREAVEAWERSPYDLILMDVQMPEMDGFEATAAIREKEEAKQQHIPIIAMTAHAMVGYREKCLEAGMDDYIAKPIQLDELARKIDACMNASDAAAAIIEAGAQAADDGRDVMTLDEVRRMAQGDEDFVGELIDDFIGDTTRAIEALDKALAENDAPTARRSVHSIKGLSRSVGANHLSDHAHKMEDLAAEGNLDAIRPMVENLRQRLTQVQGDLQSQLAEARQSAAT